MQLICTYTSLIYVLRFFSLELSIIAYNYSCLAQLLIIKYIIIRNYLVFHCIKCFLHLYASDALPRTHSNKIL